METLDEICEKDRRCMYVIKELSIVKNTVKLLEGRGGQMIKGRKETTGEEANEHVEEDKKREEEGQGGEGVNGKRLLELD